MSEPESPQGERGATRAGRPALAPAGLAEERTLSADTAVRGTEPKAPAATSRNRPRRTTEEKVWGTLRVLTIIFLVLITVMPFWYMIVLSVRPIAEVVLNPGKIWVGFSEITTESYRAVLRSTENGGQGFLVFLRNSGFVALVTTAVTLLAAVPGAYAVSRLRFRGRKIISGMFLVVYLFPPMVLAIPLFVLFTRFGLRGSLLGLALVYVAQTVPVAIYMLRNYFETIPESLEEAGLMDGLTHLGVLRRISLPLAIPSVTATGLYVFMIAWNEFLFALLFLLEAPNKWTVSLGLSRLAGSIEVPSTILMAGSVVLTVPIVLLFFFAERKLVEGLTSGAEKG
jgi:multiple sugar transport system permease protein